MVDLKIILDKHKLFRVGLLIKGIDGILGFLGGLVVLFISTGSIIKVFNFFTRYELIEDPDDIIANALVDFANHLSIDTKIFIALYLISYSLVKVVLVSGLRRNKKWSYPMACTVMTLFIIYQLFRDYHTHSVWLAIFTMIDIVIVYLIYSEYKGQRQVLVS